MRRGRAVVAGKGDARQAKIDKTAPLRAARGCGHCRTVDPVQQRFGLLMIAGQQGTIGSGIIGAALNARIAQPGSVCPRAGRIGGSSRDIARPTLRNRQGFQQIDRCRALRPHGAGNLRIDRWPALADIGISLAVGPELPRGRSRIRPQLLVGKRWFGGQPFAMNYGGWLNWRRQIDRFSEAELNIILLQQDYDRNDGLDGRLISTALHYERALSPRLFGRFGIRVDRQTARDPAFCDLVDRR